MLSHCLYISASALCYHYAFPWNLYTFQNRPDNRLDIENACVPHRASLIHHLPLFSTICHKFLHTILCIIPFSTPLSVHIFIPDLKWVYPTFLYITGYIVPFSTHFVYNLIFFTSLSMSQPAPVFPLGCATKAALE